MTVTIREKSLAEEASEWALSPEGRKEMAAALREAKELIDYLKEAQLLKPRVLNELITL